MTENDRMEQKSVCEKNKKEQMGNENTTTRNKSRDYDVMGVTKMKVQYVHVLNMMEYMY